MNIKKLLSNLGVDFVLFVIAFAILGRLAGYFTWAAITMDVVCAILALATVAGTVVAFKNQFVEWFSKK